MPDEPDWLTPEDLLELNKRIVGGTGEPHGVLKPHELRSSAERPRNLWLYESENRVAALAVRLMMAVAWGHRFEQGNKRTGFIAAVIFLEANGWALDVPDYEWVAERVEACVEDGTLEDSLVELFQDRLVETIASTDILPG